MFVLTRRPGEEIVVVMLHHQKQGTGISIGIEACQRFDIFRREVLERKRGAEMA